jgi:hypothetical protein
MRFLMLLGTLIPMVTVKGIWDLMRTAWSLFGNRVKSVARRVRIWWFQRSTESPPLDGIKARQIAYSVLAGDIIQVVSFQNIESPRIFIACLRRSSEIDFDRQVYVLEQVGDAYKVAWVSDRLWFSKSSPLEVSDIDNDGYQEVVFEDWSSGSGAGMKRLKIYSCERARLFRITESREWQNRAGPISPEIEIDSADDRELDRKFEEFAKQRGFLKPITSIDFDLPEFAVQRWHKENGKLLSGTVRVHRYRGIPNCQASVIATLDTEDFHWVSFFKGPVCAYEKRQDWHFVAFSAAWSYNWATCLAWDGKRIWFGLHMRDGLMSFSPSDGVLCSYESFQGSPLPRVGQLTVSGQSLVLNRQMEIPLSALIEASSTPHVPRAS